MKKTTKKTLKLRKTDLMRIDTLNNDELAKVVGGGFVLAGLNPTIRFVGTDTTPYHSRSAINAINISILQGI